MLGANRISFNGSVEVKLSVVSTGSFQESISISQSPLLLSERQQAANNDGGTRASVFVVCGGREVANCRLRAVAERQLSPESKCRLVRESAQTYRTSSHTKGCPCSCLLGEASLHVRLRCFRDAVSTPFHSRHHTCQRFLP